MLIWFIKVNIALAVFQIVYRLCFGRDTLFSLRRAALWMMAIFALAWPLVVINVHVAATAVPFANGDWADIPATIVEAPEEPSFTLWAIALGAYLAGVAFFLVRFLIQLTRIITLGMKSCKETVHGTAIRITEHLSEPFSFFGWIFVDPAKHSETEMHEILAHERTHVRELHSVDVIFFELLRIAFWANPFVWLMKSSVYRNLEYLADKDVIRSGFDRRQYQYRLLKLSSQQPLSAIANHFSKSQLKNRIAMMNKRQTPRRGAVKYALILPLICSIMLISNVKAVPVYAADGDPTTVTGTVRDEAGNPLKAVTVIFKRTSTGTVTDGDGRFSLTFEPGDNDVLLFSRVGMETVERQAADRLDVVMKESATPIGTVRITGHPTEQVLVTLRPDSLASDKEEPFMVVEEMPRFQGGDMSRFQQWAMSSLRYPEKAMKKKVAGTVVVTFVVEEDGSVGDVKVTGSVDPSLDTEAVRVVSSSPRWTPGRQRDIPVRVMLSLPVTFGTMSTGITSSLPPDVVSEIHSSPRPLFILDGFEVGYDEAIDLLPEDIESLTVLKDAAAKEMYGDKAVNGVVIIETKDKKKKSGKK